MKKVIVFVLIILLSGCRDENIKGEIVFTESEYQISTPYKSAVLNYYVVGNELNNYNPTLVSNDLMMLSKQYYKTNNSLFQEGQLLDKEAVKEIIEKLNKEYDYNLFMSVVEQDYSASNDNLKGVSIGLVINPYKPIKNSFGNYTYETIEIKKEEINKASELLVSELRSNYIESEVRIVLGLYFAANPTNSLDGGYKYIGSTFNNEIKMNELNYHRDYINSTEKRGENAYSLYKEIEEIAKEVNKNSIVMGEGLYFDDDLKTIDFRVEGNYRLSDIIYLSNEFARSVRRDSYIDIDIKFEIYNNDSIDSIILKKHGESETSIEIIGG